MSKPVCERCGIATNTTTMSRMNMDIICMTCKDKERDHPRYDEAAEAELIEVKKETRNYGGLFAGQKWPFGWTEGAIDKKVENNNVSWGFDEQSLGDVMEPADFK